MKVAFIGIGKVGFALANRLQLAGYKVLIAHDNPESESVKKALERNGNLQVLGLQEAIDAADLIFLAVPFKVAESVLTPLYFGQKTLVDCTNPVGPGISHGLESKISGSEKIAQWAGDAQVVKSYSIYGFENLEDSHFPGDKRAVMLIAGDHSGGKKQVAQINDLLGFETLDVGGLAQALHLEHMTLLWVRMVRAQGHPPHFAWAYLRGQP